MKRSKPINSETTSSPVPQQINSREELLELQRAMAGALFRPLTDDWNMQSKWNDGRPMGEFAAEFIKPNDRLSSFDRLEIYNRQYWFRVLDCLYDDYPGLLAVVGEEQFLKLATAYLTKYQSDSYTLRNLGDRLEKFLREEPRWTEPNQGLAMDMVRFEWAQVVAFDGPSKPVVTPDELIDTPPDQVRLGLQPYLSILKLDYPVDDFLIAIKKDADSLRGEASNAMNSAPTADRGSTPIPLPQPEVSYLAVHRFDNMLYFKRLEPEGYAILQALAAGSTLEDACAKAVEQSSRINPDWPTLIKEWFDNWAALGWFCRP
jgi:putative DNA-binding protein